MKQKCCTNSYDLCWPQSELDYQNEVLKIAMVSSELLIFTVLSQNLLEI